MGAGLSAYGGLSLHKHQTGNRPAQAHEGPCGGSFQRYRRLPLSRILQHSLCSRPGAHVLVAVGCRGCWVVEDAHAGLNAYRGLSLRGVDHLWHCSASAQSHEGFAGEVSRVAGASP